MPIPKNGSAELIKGKFFEDGIKSGSEDRVYPERNLRYKKVV